VPASFGARADPGWRRTTHRRDFVLGRFFERRRLERGVKLGIPVFENLHPAPKQSFRIR